DGVVAEGAAPDFISRIDARAGGSNPTRSFLYFRFTDSGLEKKMLSDEDAFTSLDWDIAWRRYVLRLNSGVSGPSCVDGARTAPNTDYTTLSRVPDNLLWRTEAYFTPPTPPATTCTSVEHPSGLSLSTALSSWWEYPGCVKTTGNVYVVRTREGRYVKLEVTSYYTPAAQVTCNTTGAMGAEAAIVRMRWSFIAPPP
ncbi:MAG: HmuY family protein, partial [Myxococcaceae bacterium]|nr:HmuY family protein [Myxococcaceae bacterium]